MIEFAWNPEYGNFILAILWTVVGFACYYFLSRKQSLAIKIWKANPDLDPQIKQVVLQRTWGLIFMGIISALFILLVLDESLINYGIGFSFLAPPVWWSYISIPIILLIGYFSTSKPGNLDLYPQIRIKSWTPGILVLSSISWIYFLIGYELLFRGFLLFCSLDVLGTWAAIALNCSLYAFAHLYKGPGEAFGSIPVGVFLCYLTISTGNIWAAVIVHSVMALTNEWFSIYHNPELKIIVGKSKSEEE